MTILEKHSSPALRSAFSDTLAPLPRLLGVGCAAPPSRTLQSDAAAQMAKLWQLGDAAQQRLRRICENSEIDARHGVLPLEQVVPLTTQQRMEIYEREAPLLAERAAREALHDSGARAEHVTDLIIVSCTGFSAPGVDAQLVQRLGLPARTARCTLGFHGCYGAVSALRLAQQLCTARPDAIALVVCVELCSLHFRDDRSIENQVVSMLFADGAAAVVVAGRTAAQAVMRGADGGIAKPLALGAGHVQLAPEHADAMSWRITDAGFAMTLSPKTPALLREMLAPVVKQCEIASHMSFATFLVHPGGREIVDAVDRALALDGRAGIEHARRVMREFGNMSSATLLFVLREALMQQCDLPALLMAFGPGLTIEAIPVV